MKSWSHIIERSWKVLTNIILILISIKWKESSIPLGVILNVLVGFHDCPFLAGVYIAALCGCHESTAASCGLSINSLPASCGSPTVFNKHVMVMFRNFHLHPISNFQTVHQPYVDLPPWSYICIGCTIIQQFKFNIHISLPIFNHIVLYFGCAIKLRHICHVRTVRQFCIHNKANLRDLIAATGLVILLKLDSNHRFFSPCDLEI